MSRSPTMRETQRGWGKGKVTDLDRAVAPKDSVQEANGFKLDADSTFTRVGGAANATTTTTSDPYRTILFQRSAAVDSTSRAYLYENGTFSFRAWTPTSGTNALSTNTWTPAGSAAQYAGTLSFAYGSHTILPTTASFSISGGIGIALGGSDFTRNTNYGFANALTITSNDPTITGLSATDTSTIDVGGYVVLQDAGSTKMYSGRVVSKDTGSNTMVVEPTPRTGFTGAIGACQFEPGYVFRNGTGSTTSGYISNATCGCVYQNRILFGNVAMWETTQVKHANRLVWSILPTETPSKTTYGATLVTDGLPFVNNYYEPLNYIDVPVVDRIVALVPLDYDSLLVVGTKGTARIDGVLSTVTNASSPLTVSVRTVSSELGCIEAKTVRKTPIGVLYASVEGVIRTDGVTSENMMKGRISNAYRATVGAGSSSYPQSSFVGTGHYGIGLGVNMYFMDLATGAWAFCATPGTSMVLRDAVQDAGSPERVYGLIGPLTGDIPLFRIDKMFTGTQVANLSGSANNAVQLTTQAFTFGDESTLKRLKRVTITVDAAGAAGTLTVRVRGQQTGVVATFTDAISVPASGTKRITTVLTPTSPVIAGSFVVDIITGSSVTNQFTTLRIVSIECEARELRGSDAGWDAASL